MRILTALFTFGLLHASMGQMDGSGSGDDSDMETPIPSSNINTSTPKQLASTTVVLGGEDDEDTNDVYFVSSGEKECEGSGDCEEPLVTLPTMKPSEKTTTSTTPVPVQPDSKITVSEEIISIEDVVKLGIGIGEDVIQDFVQTTTQSQLPTRSPTKRPTELIYRIQTDPPTTAVKPDPTEEVKTRQYDLTAGNVGGRTVERTEITVPPLIGHPGILAAVIGGGVVALLCAILLVMFIVYRMRKKDEGSYPLDDKPRHAAYTSVPSKEFFA